MWSRMPIYQPGRGQVHTGGAPLLCPACRSTVLNALLKSNEVKWVYGRPRVPSRARLTALTIGSTPPLVPMLLAHQLLS
jgi:hypothetical protein